MFNFVKLFATILMTLATSAYAGSPKNADPFGFELGVASLSDVKSKVGPSNITNKGINKYSNGAMIDVNSDYFEIDEVNSVLMIFDASDILAGVIVNMRKNPVSMHQTLSKKYRTVRNTIDSFMNHGSSKLAKGNSLVYIDAPHMSFKMDVRYVTNQLDKAFDQSVLEEAKSKQNHKEKSF